MDKKNRSDLKISGSANASGGFYNNVVINGQGDINGNFDCIDLKVSGTSDVDGNVKTKTGKIIGRTAITGNLETDEFKVSGILEVRGAVDAKEMRIDGTAVVGGKLYAEHLEIKGGFKVKGDCTAETFISKGAFSVGGLLNAGDVDIVLYGPCRAKEIGGETISVRKGNTFRLGRLINSILFSFDLHGGLSVETIEGDDIYLEDTKAKAVRGNNVSIGQGCDIGLVEYKGKFEQSKQAKVNENKKVH
ncbi:MAG: polymer-forming cytoskeletal protein [Bacteroidota bacterium]